MNESTGYRWPPPTLSPETGSVPPEGKERPGGLAESLQALLGRASERGRLQFLALVRVDQLRRWHGGERVLVESYVAWLPRLGEDAEALLDLIFSEVLLREELGECPAPDEYVRRFPQHEAQVRLQFEMHQELLASAAPPQGDTKHPAGLQTDKNLLTPSSVGDPGGSAGAFRVAPPTVIPVPPRPGRGAPGHPGL